ncbi:2-oxoglutarate dehydrogenase E1 component [Actinobacillus pleuropneumoniae]|uniref:oxoglutarate dehydrogenase (succinyl-transferring) n=1 Tax=Actinobacillus pleuropneumoniae TaxID=715 RepID=A0ABN5MGX6_ACTPL|nr:2-oxoglutarate dehydrogenase E1 component [Actinobacillus pleuropneumoniae]ASU16404.1 2-oxoglutarate dehydrogenase E1 component [Actinobacillus pleuropneumoniae]AWG94873.1 2-oxoglutarate dehydrogenase E1 component [Actinobacillus pleuropneumoniae serovar 1 str. 4074]AXA20946.1 2-oxoglutarate dehydrogenase E1 component [Actinobacillus pleuropneumoniae]EFM90351.1 2-oxoglutarate dehydrogenase E1 component [Actinobacillus pleuropneumoniae serovar 4 str. M62]EFM98912.1 2-oxoglutarate dehydrogena
MQHKNFEDWLASSPFGGSNQTYVEEIYEQYLENPANVDASWRVIFDTLPKTQVVEQPHSQVRDYFRKLARENVPESVTVIDPEASAKQVRLLQWINAHRFRGYLEAKLDPINYYRWKISVVPELDYRHHGFTEADLNETVTIGKYVYGKETMKFGELADALKQTYLGTIGLEFMHVQDMEQRNWLQAKIESTLNKPLFTHTEKVNLLTELTAADGLERYLGAKFPGAKRFSLEGSDAFIPMMKEIIRHAGRQGMKDVVMGMAHRGRLNMLVNVLGKRPAELFDEFAGKHADDNRTGDVKYHQGFSSDFDVDGERVHLTLAFNPSHLEIVSPVVIGSVRARQERIRDTEHNKVLAVTVHGDSAVAGQGVVQETLNMSNARGYKVGGTIRIVINNQIGFTTSNPNDTRSTEFCTDIAKMIQAPIIHVNGDDPEAVAFAARMAVEYRTLFKRDIFIDLISYRRHGHNEADEPLATQPMMYSIIKKHPTPRKVYADRLVAEGVLNQDQATEIMNNYRDALDNGDRVVPEWREMDMAAVDWLQYLNYDWTAPYESKFPQDRFYTLAKRVCEYPESLRPHSRVEKIYSDRKEMYEGKKLLDWGMAETMAYATLLDEGTHVRLSGEDAGRGTFFHRHAVVHNQNDGTGYVPLAHLHANQGRFEVWDSVLSEEAVLAFEYGYATTDPKTLTIWEAQFGDFANGAQIVIDQFISSGEQKWGRMCGLVMLLPHGYEGQGPEHSSARLERYLQLCAQQNMQVCVPSTPAQAYHMLRRQAIRKMRRPLVAITPKSLLRHPLAVSSLEELTEGEFQNVIGEIDSNITAKKVKRVVMCSGKVYYDLLEQRRQNEQTDVAIIRIEQLYPFPYEDMKKVLEPYVHVKDFVWCQEEPQNQGAWYCSKHNFEASIPEKAKLTYAGRPASASPAVGYTSLHAQQQKQLVDDALTL